MSSPAIGHPQPPQNDVLADIRRAAAAKWAGHPERQQAGLFQRADDEITMLRGQRDVLVRALRECGDVIATLVPESAEEEAMLQRLLANPQGLTSSGAPGPDAAQPDLLSC